MRWVELEVCMGRSRVMLVFRFVLEFWVKLGFWCNLGQLTNVLLAQIMKGGVLQGFVEPPPKQNSLGALVCLKSRVFSGSCGGSAVEVWLNRAAGADFVLPVLQGFEEKSPKPKPFRLLLDRLALRRPHLV